MCEREKMNERDERRRAGIMETCSYLCRCHMDDLRVPQQKCHILHTELFTGALLLQTHLLEGSIATTSLMKSSTKEHPNLPRDMQTAKKEGFSIEVHWQDADSSSSKCVRHFPDALVMMCGGHAGRAHLKQLQNFAKSKTFTKIGIEVDMDTVKCEHQTGCGYLSNTVCQINFSSILSSSQIFTRIL